MSFPSIQVPATASVSIPNRDDGWAPGPRDISVTPSGQHMWAMTPGGTKLIWTRDQLMHLSHSPLSKSPLTLPPQVLFLGKGAPLPQEHQAEGESEESNEQDTGTQQQQQNGTEDDVFVMDS